MSKENFEIALQFLFPSEGGYVNDKDDDGGPTNMGVTQDSYNYYRKKKGLPYKDVRYITKKEAVDLYYEDYWMVSGADSIQDVNMAVAMFDTAVLHGPWSAKQFYKQSNGDVNKFLDIRQKSYDGIVAAKPEKKKYYQGWNNRVNNLKNNVSSGKFLSKLGDINSRVQPQNDVVSTQKSLIENEKVADDEIPEQNIKPFQIGIEYNEYLPGYLPTFDNLFINSVDNTVLPTNVQKMPDFSDIPFANPLSSQGQPTGFATSMVEESPYQKPITFTPEEIGKMTREEFDRNEAIIIEQLKRGEINPYSQQPNYDGFNNPELDKQMIFTREDIGNMSSAEYTKYEKAINEQLKTVGIPNKSDLPQNARTYEKEKSQRSYSTNSQDGRWVTINGNHVFIEND